MDSSKDKQSLFNMISNQVREGKTNREVVQKNIATVEKMTPQPKEIAYVSLADIQMKKKLPDIYPKVPEIPPMPELYDLEFSVKQLEIQAKTLSDTISVKQSSMVNNKDSIKTDGEPELKRRDKQIKSICDTANTLGYELLNIPKGGKTKIETECLKNQSLFTKDGFKRAWIAANKQNLISMEDKQQYL